MTYEAAEEKLDSAKGLQERGEYTDSANAYVVASYEFLGENGLEHSVSAALGLESLLRGAACDRFRGARERSRNLCWQGVYVSQAIAEEALDKPRASNPHDQSERGVWSEFNADFREVGELPGVAKTYDQVERIYRDAGDPQSVSSEQFHMAAAALPKMLFRGTDTCTEELDTILQPGRTITEWIAFKRKRLPVALKHLDDAEEWKYVF